MSAASAKRPPPGGGAVLPAKRQARPAWAPQQGGGAAGVAVAARAVAAAAAVAAAPHVGADVQLAERLRHTAEPLPASEVQAVEQAALHALAALDPLLRHLVTVKLVRNERRNFVNLRIHKEYVPLVHSQTAHPSGTRYLFCLSLFIEPFVTVFAVHPSAGRCNTWGGIDGAELSQAVASFKARHGVRGESYRYSDTQPPAGTLDAAVRGSRGRPGREKGGAPFRLEIRVATQMFTGLVPTLRLLLPTPALREVLGSVASLPPEQVHGAITAIEPALRHFVQRGRAGCYPELRLYFLATVYCVEKHGVIYDVHLSDKFEPFAVVAAVHRQRGSLRRLSPAQLADLEEVLEEFRAKFAIHGESYHYTCYAERAATDAFVAGGGASTRSKAHSSDFHLKIRVSSRMYCDRLRIFRCFDFARVKTEVEPVRYNVGRETVPWAQVREVLRAEAEDEARHPTAET